MRTRGFRPAWLAVAPMLAAGLIAVSPVPQAGAATADACQTWNGSQPVNPPSGTGPADKIASVAAVSACDVWAVGSYQDQDADAKRHALIEHWAGGSWTVSPTPPALPSSLLFGVSAVSASNVWAVGQDFDNGQALILHWDGDSWARFASPVPADGTAALISIDALSASDAWAVGSVEDPSHNHQLLAMHWDGTAWTSKTVPPADGDGGELISVSGVSGSDMWALDSTSNKQPQMYHFDGNGWTQQDFPVPADSRVTGLTAVSANNVWAAGFDPNSSNGNPEPLMMHWDGSGWNQVHPAIPGGVGSSSFLTGVASSSASDVWASGYDRTDTAQDHPFVMHWDGSSWTGLEAPGQAAGNRPTAVALSGPGQAWIAGSGSSGQAFAAPVPVVPDVSGHQVGAAIATMVTFGLGEPPLPLGHTTACPPSSSGLVVSTNPAAGLREPYGLPVNLTVCDTPATVAVPDVLSFDNTSARAAITAAGLTVGSVTKQANCTLSAGGVLTQNPGGGAQVPPGSSVHLTESTGKQANGKHCVVN